MRPKYPEIEVQLSGEDGNAFMIIGRTLSAMRRAGVPDRERDEYRETAMGGDYDNVLQTTMAWVSTS